MGTLPEEDAEWEQMNRTNWKGLSLTDPIKNIEVSKAKCSGFRI
jgi:DNA-directed RNA polymerase III subunit RPC2